MLIHTEMISHARIIPLEARAPAGRASHPLFGDPVGWWEGDTLVIETTNFNAYHAWQDHPAYLSKTGKVTERFTRVAEDKLLYDIHGRRSRLLRAAVEGRDHLLERWRASIYEYACHEGNYAMDGILMGARVREALGLPLDQANEE